MRYYFDVTDGKQIDFDNEGLECVDFIDACSMAVDGIAGIMRDMLPGGTRRSFKIRMREKEGEYLFECALDFRAFDLRAQPAL